jgi:lipopolysaccharide export system protein LptA
MSRLPEIVLLSCIVLFAACSKQEPVQVDESEWADLKPMADDAVAVPVTEPVEEPNQASTISAKADESAAMEKYSRYAARLKEMQSIERGEGETLLTGNSLVLDYDRHYVRLDGQVKVQDEYGTLEAETLLGHFSASNEVEYVEAGKGVVIRSKGREATADSATYNHEKGEILLAGRAQVFEGGNRLAGERILFWMDGRRKIICEPNALFAASEGFSLALGAETQDEGMTEIRSNRIVYDEGEAVVRFDGDVRLRDPRGAMNCLEARLYLKDGYEIDWIEAGPEVIIQTDDRKALSDKAHYYADAGKFVLEGDPKVMQDRNIMTGGRITFWHGNRRLLCEPKARVLLYPDEEMRAKFLQDLKE